MFERESTSGGTPVRAVGGDGAEEAPATETEATATETLATVLARHPDAIVSAINPEDGFFVAMPPSVPIDGHRVAVARSALDLVAAEDRRAMIDAWVEGKERGRSWVDVSLAGEPPTPATVHVFDETEEHGVFIGVIVASAATDVQLTEVAEIPPPPPRVAYSRKDEVATIVHVDAAVRAMLGWEDDEILGRSSLDFVHPDDAARSIDIWMECLSRRGSTCRTRLRHLRSDGSWIWLELSNTNLLAEPDAGYVECEMVDISEEMEAHEAVRASEQVLSRLTAALPVGVAHFDHNRRITYANERLYEIIGVEANAPEHSLMTSVVDRAGLERAITAVHAGQDVCTRVVVKRLDDGEQRECTLTMRSLTSEDGEVVGGVLVLDDVTEEARMRSELEYRATFDELTNCANRRTALNRLSEALTTARLRRPRTGTAVIFVDLDDFKDVNDAHGHATGDAVLNVIGARLQRVVRGQDLVGRIGGDEFLVVCPEVADEQTAVAMAERVSAAMEAPIEVASLTLRQTVSVGVSWTGARPATDADTLIAEADEAMYTAKRKRGPGSVVVSLHG